MRHTTRHRQRGGRRRKEEDNEAEGAKSPHSLVWT